MLRMLREHPLLGQPQLQLQAKRTPGRRKPRPTNPHAWWGIEMTKVVVEGFGWVSSGLGLDWYPKKSVGDDAGMPCTARQWLAARDLAVNRQVPEGAREQGWSWMSDHGCQPTSVACMKACSPLGLQQAFTSDTNPKGKADTERGMRTRKEEGLWWLEGTSPLALIRALEGWSAYDQAYDLHSSLGYQSPRPFARDDHLSHGTPFAAA
jgi:putative transposase